MPSEVRVYLTGGVRIEIGGALVDHRMFSFAGGQLALAYFLCELFTPLRLHPLQYSLIGMANCVFYLLLLALAEHIGFAPAYVASAVALTALITSYSGAVLRSVRRAASTRTWRPCWLRCRDWPT